MRLLGVSGRGWRARRLGTFPVVASEKKADATAVVVLGLGGFPAGISHRGGEVISWAFSGWAHPSQEPLDLFPSPVPESKYFPLPSIGFGNLGNVLWAQREGGLVFQVVISGFVCFFKKIPCA